MKPPEREPTQDELLAMAYADGELRSDQRAVVERRIALEPALARQVAEYRSLELLARQMAPAEPEDHEWARLELETLYWSGTRIGGALVAAGAAGLGLWTVVEVLRSDMDAMPKTCVLALVGGLGALLLTTLAARLRVLPFDPYRKVKR